MTTSVKYQEDTFFIPKTFPNFINKDKRKKLKIGSIKYR